MKTHNIAFILAGVVYVFGWMFGSYFPDHPLVTQTEPSGYGITVAVNAFGFLVVLLLAIGLVIKQNGQSDKHVNSEE